jgi:hypothetical protein
MATSDTLECLIEIAERAHRCTCDDATCAMCHAAAYAAAQQAHVARQMVVVA